MVHWKNENFRCIRTIWGILNKDTVADILFILLIIPMSICMDILVLPITLLMSIKLNDKINDEDYY